jgi:gamma-D-glutamyl-L-lysine dipeptidyl-peptidase
VSRRSRGGAAPRIDELIEAVRREHAPDFRSAVFDVHVRQQAGTFVVDGQATADAAVVALLERLRDAGISADDRVQRLPEPLLAAAPHALVRAAVAPVYAAPYLPAPQISQLVLGMRVALVSNEGDWVRVRAEDGYLGWVHRGYLLTGPEEWAHAWERGTTGEPLVSLGAELHDDDGGIIARLPWGARLARVAGGYELPDGRRGVIGGGEVVDVDRLADRFPPRGDSVARTARRWLGAPYLWGGVTLNGVDCSGFTQAVLWMHGIALPRDSDLQERTGTAVPVDGGTDDVRAGDLLYFAEPGQRISHVAVSLGGAGIIHSALGNGGVDINDLNGELPLEQRLRRMLVSARRMLPD